MRDTFKSNGLRDNILEAIEEIPNYEKDIFEEQRKDIKAGLKGMLLDTHLEKTIAHYSVGDDKETVTNSLLELIPAFEDAWEYEIGAEYEDALWIVSMAILCDIDLENFKRITTMLRKENLNDALFSTLIRSKQEDWPQSNRSILFDKELFSRIINSTSAAEIKTYLDKYWYQAHNETYWYNLHKNTRVNNYFGYWSWEAAAIAKIKGIDDSSLKNQKYYPFDAVHW